MLRDVPVVDRSVGVARGQHLHVTVAVFHVWLAVIDVVLVECLLVHHHGVLVQVDVVEEDSAAAEGIVADPRILGLSEATVCATAELP